MKKIFIVLIAIACMCLGCCAGRFVLDSLNVDWSQNYQDLLQENDNENENAEKNKTN